MGRPRKGRSASTDVIVGNPAASGEAKNVAEFRELDVPLTALEETFCRLYILYNNATRAYVEAANYQGKRYIARTHAWEMLSRPCVMKRVRDYESAAAAAVVIDYAAILDHDRRVVEGYAHIDQVSQHIWQCCRYCHGNNFDYQWIDHAEYFQAIAKAAEENERRVAMKKRELPQPRDDGGYGFDAGNEPNILCPKCEGRGTEVLVLADTTKLQGPVKAVVIGAKMGKYGPEIILHDVDKAKDRLLRAGGIFKDDAASVARGAAAGAAAGATAAIAAARAAAEMTSEEAQRLYLELA
jgi:phage terminase small subunit